MIFQSKRAFSKNAKHDIFIKITFSIFAILFCFPAATAGCSKRDEVDAYPVLLAMLSAEAELPAGDAYLLPHPEESTVPSADSSAPGTPRMADEALLYAAFGGSAGSGGSKKIPELSTETVDSGALYLSTAEVPFECMVFRCVSRTDTDAVVMLLLHRLDALRRQYQGTEGQEIIENARVVIHRKFVIFAVGKNAESMVDAGYSALK